MDFKKSVAEEICSALEIVFGQTDLSVQQIQDFIEIPPDSKMGNYAFPCFRLAKALKKAPPAIAAELASAIGADFLEKVQAVSGYLNFYIDSTVYAQTVLNAAAQQKERYGSSDVGAGKTVCIDYSSINIAKRFHIGHLSTTMIGNALYKLYEFSGYKCVGINYLGDWGTQFGKLISAYKRWGNPQDVEQGGIDALTELYVRFDREAASDPELMEEGRAWFKKIEDGDAEALQIFEWFKEITLRDAQRVYDMLGVSFDSYNGESYYNDKMDAVVNQLRKQGLLVESDGAYVVDLEEYDMPPCLILKTDGATLYATRDLAAALDRKNTYGFSKSLYVVAYQQDLHFRQVLKLMGYEWAQDCKHVAFGMVSYEGQAMATRKGHVVYLEDLLNKAVEKARSIIEEKSPNLEDKDKVARQVGVGAVVFFDLYSNRINDIDFWWDRALQFDGETGPYVQYTHARCCSVLRKVEPMAAQPDFSSLTDDEAQDVLRLINAFPQVIASAVERNEPSLVTRFSVDLAQAYNRFYRERRVITENESVSAARVLLTDVTRQTIKTALNLIGIEAPEKM